MQAKITMSFSLGPGPWEEGKEKGSLPLMSGLKVIVAQYFAQGDTANQ